MAIVLNGTTYNGGANPTPPTKITTARIKIGKVLSAANGKRHFMSRSTRTSTWTLTWANANATTRAAVAALHALNIAFTFVDQFGTANTVQCEDEEHTEGTAFTAADTTIYYDLQLVLHQAT